MCNVDKTDFTLSVVVPIYNEARTLQALLDAVRSAPFKKQIILVDDGSSDASRPIMEAQVDDESNTFVKIFHETNKGTGAALRTGFAAATGDAVIVQDADLEYDPNEYPSLLAPILDGKGDVVFGSRFMGGAPHRVLYYWHSVGNKFLTMFSNWFTNLNLTDMETCYKVFRTPVLKAILPSLQQDRFGFEPEITAKIAKMGVRVKEVPISYNPRTNEEGKKIGLKDGFRAIYCIWKYRKG